MSTLIYGLLREGVPSDENVVRRNTFAVEPDAPPAEMQAGPEFNEVETDDNPNLGLVNRQLASDWHESEQYRPGWIGDVNANHDHNDIINKQVSTSGTAAAREDRGEFGHGTMAYAVGIEPTVGATPAFGNDYFTTHEREINETAGLYMQPPPGSDNDERARIAAQGNVGAYQASVAGKYADWYSAMMDGRA